MSIRMWKRETALGLAFICLGLCVCGVRADEGKARSEPAAAIVTGTGERYKTTVSREVVGQLKPEDFRQASLLSSRIIVHVNAAVDELVDEQVQAAQEEIDKAVKLAEIVRELLPTVVVTTVVQDSKGKEVYREVDRVQDDRIPLFAGTVEVEILEPVTEAKEEAAEVKGVRLRDVDLLHTSVLVDLGYVERKLRRARELLKANKRAEALAQLVAAQVEGVQFVVHKRDSPLVEAQRALQLAERMVEEERYDAAKANLQLAKNHLAVFRSLIGKAEGKKVSELEQQISQVQNAIREEGAAARIRDFWHRVASWFTREAGEARPTQKQTGIEKETGEAAEKKEPRKKQKD